MKTGSGKVTEIDGLRLGKFVKARLNGDGMVGVVYDLHPDSAGKIEVRFVENQSVSFDPSLLALVDAKDAPQQAVDVKIALGLWSI
jgi:hypothetical protein